MTRDFLYDSGNASASVDHSKGLVLMKENDPIRLKISVGGNAITLYGRDALEKLKFIIEEGLEEFEGRDIKDELSE